MKGLGKSCLRWLLFYAILGAALSFAAYERIPNMRLALIAGFVAAIPLWLFLGSCYGIAQRHAEMRMVRRSMAPEPRDGRKVAISGTVRGTLRESPMMKRRCVAYEYKVFPGVESPVGVLEGFSMSDVHIDGSRGSMRLLAVPELAFPALTLDRAARANFEAYVAHTHFTTRPSFDLRNELAHMQSIFDEDDGTIRYDLRRDIPGMTLHELTHQEKILEPGERVIAIGRYSEERHGLVHDPNALLHSVKIMKGDPETIARTLAKPDRKEIPVTIVFLLLFIGCVLLWSAAAAAAAF